MPRGYEEGPVAEEAERRRDDAERGRSADERAQVWPAVFGSTEDNPERHFLGWLEDVDPDELFASGKAWGITIVRTRVAAE
jgi:hypothetical protein